MSWRHASAYELGRTWAAESEQELRPKTGDSWQAKMLASFARDFISQQVCLPPFCVTIGDHHVEAPCPAFLRRFHQSQIPEILEIRFQPLVLRLGEAAPRQIHGGPGEMRGRRLANFRR